MRHHSLIFSKPSIQLRWTLSSDQKLAFAMLSTSIDYHFNASVKLAILSALQTDSHMLGFSIRVELAHLWSLFQSLYRDPTFIYIVTKHVP